MNIPNFNLVVADIHETEIMNTKKYYGYIKSLCNMAFMLKNIYWKGNMPASEVEWILAEEQTILEDIYEEKRKRIWREIQSQHPSSYDGDLLNLKRFEVKSGTMRLHMNIIKFSRILTLEKLGTYLKPYGTIGMQMIVFSSDRKHILVGQRDSNVMYCPNYFSSPGGMLEITDAKGSFETACLREFREEAELELSNDLRLLAITSEINGTVGVVFILEGQTLELPDIEKPVKGNDEWMGSQLHWRSMKNLDGFDQSNSLESILFLKEEYL